MNGNLTNTTTSIETSDYASNSYVNDNVTLPNGQGTVAPASCDNVALIIFLVLGWLFTLVFAVLYAMQRRDKTTMDYHNLLLAAGRNSPGLSTEREMLKAKGDKESSSSISLSVREEIETPSEPPALPQSTPKSMPLQAAPVGIIV